MQTVRAAVEEAPEDRVTDVELRVAVGPAGETDVISVMVPLKPLRLANVTVR